MKKLFGTVALIGMLTAPGTVEAQFVVGAATAYNTDLEDFGLGAYATFRVPQLHENIAISGNFLYYFRPDPLNAFELNGDVIYSFPLTGDSPLEPFALAGLNIYRTSLSGFSGSGSTDIGLNLGGGVVIPMETVRPFGFAKFEFQDNTLFVLGGGIGIMVG